MSTLSKPRRHDVLDTVWPTLTLVVMVAMVALGCTGCDTGASPKQARGGANALQGQRLLAQYQCGSCHVIPDVAAARGRQGPSLKAFGKRSYIAGHVPNTPEALALWIVAPTAVVADTSMPSMGVSPTEARDMAAYLGALR